MPSDPSSDFLGGFIPNTLARLKLSVGLMRRLGERDCEDLEGGFRTERRVRGEVDGVRIDDRGRGELGGLLLSPRPLVLVLVLMRLVAPKDLDREGTFPLSKNDFPWLSGILICFQVVFV